MTGRRKALPGGQGKGLVFLCLGVGLGGILLIVGVIASKAGLHHDCLLFVRHPELPHVLLFFPIVAVSLFLGLWMTVVCVRQSLKDRLGLREKPLVLQILVGALFTFMIFMLMSMLAQFFIGLPAGVVLGVGLALGQSSLPLWLRGILAGTLLLMSLPALLLAFAMTHRAAWLWGMRRQIETLPTSTVRGAAAGLVELRGAARRIGEGPPEQPLLGFNPDYQRDPSPKSPYTFYLEDATGRVRIDPPKERDGMDARLHLKPGEGHGVPVLLAGDPVLVIGSLEPDRQAPPDAMGPDRMIVRPWSPPFDRFRSFLFCGGLGFAWLEADWISGCGVFLVTNGDEGAAKRSLLRWRRWWVLLGALQMAGALATTAVALTAVLAPHHLQGLSLLLRP